MSTTASPSPSILCPALFLLLLKYELSRHSSDYKRYEGITATIYKSAFCVPWESICHVIEDSLIFPSFGSGCDDDDNEDKTLTQLVTPEDSQHTEILGLGPGLSQTKFYTTQDYTTL
jgi:hypothetical protein